MPCPSGVESDSIPTSALSRRISPPTSSSDDLSDFWEFWSRRVLHVRETLGADFLADVNLVAASRRAGAASTMEGAPSTSLAEDDAGVLTSTSVGPVEAMALEHFRRRQFPEIFGLSVFDDLHITEITRNSCNTFDDLHSFLRPPEGTSSSTTIPSSTRKTLVIESWLRSLVLADVLKLPDYFVIASDAPRHAEDGVYLEQRLRGFELLWQKWLETQQTVLADDFLAFYRGNFKGCLQIAMEEKDRWQTGEEALRVVADIIFGREQMLWQRRTTMVWQPFLSDGRCAEHLRELGIARVVHVMGSPVGGTSSVTSDNDFFRLLRDVDFRRKIDLVWDNPPYTSTAQKLRVLRALKDAELPFCLLFPASIIGGAGIREIFAGGDAAALQFIHPRKVAAIPLGEAAKASGKVVQCSGLVWVCWRLDLQRDVYLV